MSEQDQPQRQVLRTHGRTHLPGGSDPIPALPPSGASGIPIATMFFSNPGVLYTASGARVYLFDDGIGAPNFGDSDSSVFFEDVTTDFTGSDVWAIQILAEGTYELQAMFQERTGPGATGYLFDFENTDGALSTFFQGRYGATSGDNWENPVTGAGTSELFYTQWFTLSAGQAPAWVTPAVIMNGSGTVRAMSAFTVKQLSPTRINIV